jgi:hypothetical protein
MRSLTTSSNVEGLGERLKVINPNNGWNPLSNCIACAEETANVLTMGKDPVAATGEDEFMDSRVATKKFKGTSAAEVWNWCFQNLKTWTVYAVYMETIENDDIAHAWNLVRSSSLKIYLIDSNQHTFKLIQRADDGYVEVRNSPDAEENSTFDMHYFGGETLALKLYEWGPLLEKWKMYFQDT